MECLHSRSKTLLIDDSVICSMCGKQIGFSNGYIPDPSHIECSFVQKKSTSGSGYSIRKPKDNRLSFALPALTAAVIRNPERLNQQSLVQQNITHRYVHSPPGPYSSPRSRRHLVQHNRLSDDEVCLRSTEAPLLLKDILERMNPLPSGSCASRTSGRRGLRRKRRIPDKLHTPSNLDGTAIERTFLQIHQDKQPFFMEPNGGPSVQGAGPNSTMPPVEAAPLSSLDGTSIVDNPSGKVLERVKVLHVFSPRKIIGSQLIEAFKDKQFEVTKVLQKTDHSALIFFENDLIASRALITTINYKEEILTLSLPISKEKIR